nr:hypothetical protein [Clostridia bacterium]
YRVNIENIRDIGGYSTWGVVRIGENNWYLERLSELGETYGISIRGVYSLSMGTVSINSTLMDSSIRDVYAGGTSMAAISTYARSHINSESGNFVKGGVTMKNVLFENIHYNGTAGHNNEGSLTEPGKPYNGCALDFRSMRDSDTLERVVFRDVFARDGAELWMADDRYVLDVRN